MEKVTIWAAAPLSDGPEPWGMASQSQYRPLATRSILADRSMSVVGEVTAR